MKVLILTTVMAPYRVELFNEIGKYCELTVCFEQKQDLARDEKWYDNNISNFKFIPLKGWEKSLKSIKFDVINVLNKTKPDLAVAYEYSTTTAMVFMSYCKMKKIPYAINCDGAFISKSYKDVIKRHYIKNASACLSSGKMATNYFIHYGAPDEKIHTHNFTTLKSEEILENPVSKEEKKELKKELGINYDRVIISVGQFIHRKGMDVLIKSVADISREVGVYIIGGKAPDEYKALIDEYGLKNVHFLEFMVPSQLNKYFKAADLFVLPTREDVWGLVINEAMAKGLPVITTDKCVAGIELIENGKNGYIVSVDNIQETVGAINDILFDDLKKEKMSVNNLNKIKDYTIEESAEMICTTFEKFNKLI